MIGTLQGTSIMTQEGPIGRMTLLLEASLELSLSWQLLTYMESQRTELFITLTHRLQINVTATISFFHHQTVSIFLSQFFFKQNSLTFWRHRNFPLGPLEVLQYYNL